MPGLDQRNIEIKQSDKSTIDKYIDHVDKMTPIWINLGACNMYVYSHRLFTESELSELDTRLKLKGYTGATVVQDRVETYLHRNIVKVPLKTTALHFPKRIANPKPPTKNLLPLLHGIEKHNLERQWGAYEQREKDKADLKNMWCRLFYSTVVRPEISFCLNTLPSAEDAYIYFDAPDMFQYDMHTMLLGLCPMNVKVLNPKVSTAYVSGSNNTHVFTMKLY